MMRKLALTATFLILTAVISFGQAEEASKLDIYLDAKQPELSYGELKIETTTKFPVGLGRKGILPAGSTFKGGYSLLGKFRINAVLTADRFEMDPALITSSGNTEAWLKTHLFSNMSSIDFDNDGKGGEYGSAFLSLEPIDSKTKQPFKFATYKGVFRWYSFAIHGTQDEQRVGKCATGGCINVKQETLVTLLAQLKLGDVVTISERD